MQTIKGENPKTSESRLRTVKENTAAFAKFYTSKSNLSHSEGSKARQLGHKKALPIQKQLRGLIPTPAAGDAAQEIHHKSGTRAASLEAIVTKRGAEAEENVNCTLRHNVTRPPTTAFCVLRHVSRPTLPRKMGECTKTCSIYIHIYIWRVESFWW